MCSGRDEAFVSQTSSNHIEKWKQLLARRGL
jgi:hypothetical protein